MKIIFAAFLSLSFSVLAQSASVCPSTVNTNTDCGFILTVGPGAAVTGVSVPNANPYDGTDDALIGVINSSGAVFNGSITLQGSGNGGGLFAFDGDGICAYVTAAYCSTAKTGYEGPLNTFTNITSTATYADTGTVVFSGLADGASTYFSLEGSPASIGSPVILGSSPEPGTISLLGLGLAGACLLTLRKRRSSTL